jgi:hypothetical protein
MNKILQDLWRNKATTGIGLGAGAFTLYDEIDTVTTWQGGVKLAVKAILYLTLGGMARDPFKKA